MVWKQLQVGPTLILGPADDLDTPRSPGLHASQIYNSLNEELSKKVKNDSLSQSELETYRAGGFIWERVFSRAMAEGLAHHGWWRPGEVTCDGVIGSPDLLGMVDGGLALGETKCTWKSSRHLDDMLEGHGTFWVWLVQMKAYCHMLTVCRAHLYTYFVNGDYKRRVPEFYGVELTFTAAELRDNWSMLLNHARSKSWL